MSCVYFRYMQLFQIMNQDHQSNYLRVYNNKRIELSSLGKFSNINCAQSYDVPIAAQGFLIKIKNKHI